MPLVINEKRRTPRRLTREQANRVGVVRAAYLRIMFAADAGRGVVLSADECEAIATEDDAVVMAAGNAAESIGLDLSVV